MNVGKNCIEKNSVKAHCTNYHPECDMPEYITKKNTDIIDKKYKLVQVHSRSKPGPVPKSVFSNSNGKNNQPNTSQSPPGTNITTDESSTTKPTSAENTATTTERQMIPQLSSAAQNDPELISLIAQTISNYQKNKQ